MMIVIPSHPKKEKTNESIDEFENIFGKWYDITNKDNPSETTPFTSGMPTVGPQVPEWIE